MNVEKRKKTLVELGKRLIAIAEGKTPEHWAAAIRLAHTKNGWFTEENVRTALVGLSSMLEESKVDQWLSTYRIDEKEKLKTVGVVMAGNIPLVGFHDLLCVLITGNKAKVKCASTDDQLPVALLNELKEIDAELAERVEIVDWKLSSFDAVLATGSDNSARSFEYYFGKYPSIIRKNRSSVAVLNGSESQDDLMALGRDIFRYFGLGCRNVSQIMVPIDYDLVKFLAALQPWEAINNHHKYRNNYDYYKSIFLVEKIKHLDTGFLLLKEDVSIHCPVSVLNFIKYNSEAERDELLKANEEQIQCVVSKLKIDGAIPFGKAQEPELWDYADKVDTMEFLLSLN